MSCCCDKQRRWASALVAVGVFLLISGVVALFSFPFVIERVYNSQASLVNGSAIFDMWVNPTENTPLYMNYYFFNITNAHEILSKGAKPNVTQVGPLVYREIQNKYNVTLGPKKEIVTYLNNHTFVYDAERSALKETDLIVSTNFLYWTLLGSIDANSSMSDTISTVINAIYDSNETKNAGSPFLQISAQDMLWGTNGNPFLNALKTLVPTLQANVGLQKNGSNDGVHTIYTGYNVDNENRGEHQGWNGNETLPYWKTPYCNMINGTDGTIFPTFLEDPHSLYIFSPDLCRSLLFDEQLEKQSVDGLDTSKFYLPAQVFNASDPDNKGFCVDESVCKDGLLDASKCYASKLTEDIPHVPFFNFTLQLSAIISSPHFMYADAQVIHSVNGMHPNETLHETFINVHLEMGVVVRAAKRIQVNTVLKQTPFLKQIKPLKNLPDNWTQLMPVFWLEERLYDNDAVIDEIKSKFVMPQSVVTLVSYCGVAIGIFLLIIAISIFVCCPIPYKTLIVDLDKDVDEDRDNLIDGEGDLRLANHRDGSSDA